MEIIGGQIIRNEMTQNAKGGSELMAERLYSSLPVELLKDFQIICSRVRLLDKTKYKILWCHDLAGDPEATKALGNGGWNKFHKIVFVSYWQRQQFINYYQIPHHKTTVIQNAILPILPSDGDSELQKFIYHTTPHRGLEILVPVFIELAKHYPNINLDVYSSFEIYGWKERDEAYKQLFDQIRNHPQMSYKGSVDNETIRNALRDSQIYAYPCIWSETSCLSLIEAMAAGLICVHSDLAALPETAANCTTMYGFNENPNDHATTLYYILDDVLKNQHKYTMKARMAADYANIFYDWNTKIPQWTALLQSILQQNLNRNIEEPMYVYQG